MMETWQIALLVYLAPFCVLGCIVGIEAYRAKHQKMDLGTRNTRGGVRPVHESIVAYRNSLGPDDLGRNGTMEGRQWTKKRFLTPR